MGTILRVEQRFRLVIEQSCARTQESIIGMLL